MEETGVSCIIIGGSAGSIDALMKILPQLPEGFRIPVVLVLHRKPSDDNVLEDVFSHRTKLPVVPIEDKTQLEPGKIHVAPADYHLHFEKDLTFSLDFSEKVHYSRPSIDVSFESASRIFGRNLMGIVLSGANLDGSEGLAEVALTGGRAIVQLPETAEVPFMPKHARDRVPKAEILSPENIGKVLIALTG